MRICLYTETALPKMGGQEIVVDALARQFLAQGHEPVVLAPHPRLPLRAKDTELPYQVVRHPRFLSTRWLVASYGGFLRRLLARMPFDVLHCHGIYPPAYLAALNRGRLKVPVVVTSHGGDVNPDNVRLKKAVLRERHCQGLRGADALIAISRYTRAGFEKLCPDAVNIADIPNGVDLRPFAASASRPTDLDPAIKPKEYLLFLGRLRHRKGVDVLLDALARLPASGSVQLVVAGDGEIRAKLEALTLRLGLSERVRFVGQVSGANKIYLLQNALATVVPSRGWEAFGLVVLESHAAGTPVIASDLPGLADNVLDGRTGYLVPPNDPELLAWRLRQPLAQPAKARRMGQAARHAVQKLSWAAVAARHVELYRWLGNGPARQRLAA
jgi:teichuronic acid biosynthesis glycosyltransferase TuaC